MSIRVNMDSNHVRGRWIMLVLTRRSMQTLRIGNDVTVTVLEIRGSQVRLGVSAPRDIAIHREEILDGARVKHRMPDSGS